MFTFTRLIASVSVALAVSSVMTVVAVPIDTDVSPLVARGTKAPSPAFVIYTDRFVSNDVLPPASELAGWNVVALSFLTLKGPQDQAGAFAKLPAAKRASTLAAYKKAGIDVIVSAFGETDKPTTSGADPAKTAETMAQFVLANKLAGIDVDYEDLDAMNKGDGKAEAWVVEFTQTLRKKLPKGQFILSHAPLAPWLAPNAQFKAGAYLTVNKKVGSLIDWYNVQFYNQGLYADCEGLLNKAGSPFTGSALFEIAKNGVELNKLVIGKPGVAADATNGFIDPKTLGTCVDQATKKGWKGGIMAFEFPHANAAWIKAAKGRSFH
ncbi:glycoside hydrolase [Trametes polyzona]|nr:glycoside hydrolase [Trametes polyzona]